MEYPALIFWVLIAWAIFASTRTVFILLVASMPFAGLALLPPEVAGGISILPESMFAVILLLKVGAEQVKVGVSNLLTALQLRNLGFLALFLLFALIATVIMPRLFQGEIVIMPMRAATAADLLGPTQANFTQSGYLTLSVMGALAVALVAGDRRFPDTLLTAVLAGGIVCIATGLVDFVAGSIGAENLLKPFRNAGYAFITEAEVGGVRRIIGLTPEASSYGSLCVQFGAALALLRNLYEEGRLRMVVTTVAIGLLVMAVLSTSSSAYVGLAVFGLVYAINWIRRIVASSALGQSGLLWEFVTGLAILVGLLVILAARSDLLDPLLNLITEVVLNKPLTSSYYERTHLNEVAWQAVTGTSGLGIGLGSTRTSNIIAAIVSSTGLLGAVLFGLFLLRIFLRRPDSGSVLFVELLPPLKLSLLPPLAVAAVASGGADFGLWVAAIFGTIAGLAAVPASDSYSTGDALSKATYSAQNGGAQGKKPRPWDRRGRPSEPRVTY